MALNVKNINVTGTGTAVQVTSTPTWCTSVSFQLDSESTGPAHVGLANTVAGASTAIRSLLEGQSQSIDAGEFFGRMGETFDLSQFWIDAPSGAIVHVTYFVRNY